MRLLVIADSQSEAAASLRELIVQRLPQVDLAWAGSLETGIALLRARTFDAALLDLNLPDSSGPDTLRALRASIPDLPVVVLTEPADGKTAAAALDEGAADYLVRNGLDGDSLVRSLGSAVERHRTLAGQGQAAEAQAYLAAIEASSEEAIIGIDRTGVVRRWNPASERVYGYAPEEIVGRSFALVAGGDEELKNLLDTAGAAGRGARLQTEHHHKDGSIVDAALTVSPIVSDGEVTGALLIARDITEEKLIEQQAAQASRLDSLGAIAAGIAHEFNNVLMGILPFAEVIGRKATTPDLHKAAMQIQHSVQRGRSITNEILRFTRPVQPVLKQFDLSQWLGGDFRAEVEAILRPNTSFVLKAESPLPVVGDAAQLGQVLINLVMNAQHAMPGGGTLTIGARRVQPHTRFRFAVVPVPERFVHLSVTDTGTGIAPEILPRIFEPLFTTKKATGTGLGLPIARQLVHGQKGRIYLESTLGEGTTFHILLPAVDEAGPAAVPAHFGSLRLLLVGNEPGGGSGLTDLLQLEGIETQHVSAGLRVGQAVETFHPDVVLVEPVLQDTSVLELLRAIRSQWPTLPVLLAAAEESLAGEEANALPPNVEFVGAGYHVQALLFAIHGLLEGARKQSAR